MKKIYITSFFSLLFIVILKASSGDVITINSHTNTQLTWYGGYDASTQFPSTNTEYQQILMDLTLGCSTGGCSHWDYTLQAQVGEYTGQFDSTIAQIDTIQQNPLVLDTIWNEPFEVINWYELGRIITPYGNYMDYAWGGNKYGFDSAWSKTWTFDVSMLEPLLHGDKPVRLSFSGWPQSGRGFSGDVQFRFIEGVPTKKITNIQRIYDGGSYNNSTQFEADIVPDTVVNVSASHAALRMIVTGHGADGEFTPVSYKTYANGTFVQEDSVWKTDCSDNPLSPQGGTWIFNRANWCPGDDIEEDIIDLSDYLGNGPMNLDVNFTAWTPTNGASYIISGYLIEYEVINRQYDVSVDNIVTPNNQGELFNISTANSSTSSYTRYHSPLCTNPIIEIKNEGLTSLTYCQIIYGVVGGNPFYYEWTGNLPNGKKERITLPILDWGGLDINNPVFYAEVSYPNQLVDQFPYNNRKEASFDLPQVFLNGNLTFRLRTNNQAQESSYQVFDVNGNEIFNGTGFSNSTTNEEPLTLNNGCYKLVVNDVDQYFMEGQGGDGLSWWVNTQNNLESSGYFEIRQTGGGRLQYFNPDFGHQINYDFMVGVALNEQTDVPVAPQEPGHADIETIEYNGTTVYYMADSGLYFTEIDLGETLDEALAIKNLESFNEAVSVYPNPSKAMFNVFVEDKFNSNIAIQVENSLGEIILSKNASTNQNIILDLTNKAKGVYFVKIIKNKKISVKKIELQ